MKRILIIDDDDQFREMLYYMLQRAGFDVEEAADGDKGISLQQKHPFDLVITDIIMPNKEGIGTIIELRKDYPNLKIIAISGGGRVVPNEYLDYAKKLGAHLTLSKPFERKELIDAINGLLTE